MFLPELTGLCLFSHDDSRKALSFCSLKNWKQAEKLRDFLKRKSEYKKSWPGKSGQVFSNNERHRYKNT
ncbi:unknown [[Mannheimia] succiniciproducens MBEL55E]|uniref:Uncharacterized protein n=1 Tax=Mannheimia succiniciproducens (strain KCTC 0769BP / MBEL55E) TaxID=221988 RepID=Q65RS0_MANSM|nr:unknown [[Mannheimia] succiniciproducens MBEL55E]